MPAFGRGFSSSTGSSAMPSISGSASTFLSWSRRRAAFSNSRLDAAESISSSSSRIASPLSKRRASFTPTASRSVRLALISSSMPWRMALTMVSGVMPCSAL